MNANVALCVLDKKVGNLFAKTAHLDLHKVTIFHIYAILLKESNIYVDIHTKIHQTGLT